MKPSASVERGYYRRAIRQRRTRRFHPFTVCSRGRVVRLAFHDDPDLAAKSCVRAFDARDAATLCQRLSRYVDGNFKELAVIRVPTEEEEQLRHLHRQREALVRARTKMQAQGRWLLVSHSQAALPHWWRTRTWNRLTKLLPEWLVTRLEVLRPVLTILDTQIAVLSLELEAAAPADLPRGLGKLTTVVLSREVRLAAVY